jgi:zinc protease
MRINPAPIVLGVALAAAIAVLLTKQPAPQPAAPAAPAKTEAVKDAPTPKPEPQKTPEPAAAEAVEADAKVPVWPQDQSDIPADPKAVFGKLENGLRYIIYPNAEPPQRMSIRLHIASGSLMEAEDQRGLMHFLEHMVFNGSRNFKADELVPRMQRLGIGFGAHVNAYTSFDETVYMLDLPDLTPDTVDLCFKVMRDFGDGALLAPEEIEKERGVILSEKTSRDSVDFRLMVQQFEELLPGSLVAKRFPIGEESVISKAPRERFVDLYSHFYTPDRMTVVVVGDVKPAEVEARIKDTFGGMKAPETPVKNPDLGKVTVAQGVEPAVFSDKEVAQTSLSLVTIQPFVPAADSRAYRLSRLPLEVANSILDRRFERIAKKEGSPITGGDVSRSDLFHYADLGSIDVSVADDRWQEALPVMEQEFRRALEHGFTEAELGEVKANLLSAYEQAVKSAASRRSDTLATGIARSINDQTVFSSPETDLEIIREGLNAITPEECLTAFREFWADKGMHLILTTKEEPDNATGTLSSLYEESRSKPVSAPEQKSVEAFAYQDFGSAGTVQSRQEIADLGITQFVLSNGVRVNFKTTDFEKSSVRTLVHFGGGRLTQPKNKPGLDLFTKNVFDAGGLGKHSVDDLKQILAGKNVGTGFSIEDDNFTIVGRSTPEDFGLELQLICAQLTDPGYREEALIQFRKGIPPLYQQLLHTPEGAQAEMESWLHGGDPRWTVPKEPELASYTMDDAKTWLAPELTKSYMEVSIVGDIDLTTALPLILHTLGSLPPREPAKPDYARERSVELPKTPAAREFNYDSKIPQGTACVIWPTDGLRGNQKLFRRLNLLSGILSDRLREEIREKLGASYSPDAGASGSDGLKSFGYMIAECVGKPEDTQKLSDVANTLAEALAKDGVTADELDRTRKPFLAQIERAKRDNGYWLNTVLADSQEDPTRLDLIRTRDQDYATITLEELNALAKKYFTSKNTLKVIIKPGS